MVDMNVRKGEMADGLRLRAKGGALRQRKWCHKAGEKGALRQGRLETKRINAFRRVKGALRQLKGRLKTKGKVPSGKGVLRQRE